MAPRSHPSAYIYYREVPLRLGENLKNQLRVFSLSLSLLAPPLYVGVAVTGAQRPTRASFAARPLSMFSEIRISCLRRLFLYSVCVRGGLFLSAQCRVMEKLRGDRRMAGWMRFALFWKSI